MATFERISRRSVLSAGLMGATWLAVPTLSASVTTRLSHFDLDRLIPKQFGPWQHLENAGAVLPNPDEEKAVKDAYEQVVSRTYVRSDGRFVMFVLAHGRSDSGLMVIHRAEVCYTAQGFTVQNAGRSSLSDRGQPVNAKRLVAVRDIRREQIAYWAAVAGAQTDVGIAQKLRVLRAGWEGRPIDAFLVRASTIETNDPQAFALVDQFLTDLIAVLPPNLGPLITGTAIA